MSLIAKMYVEDKEVTILDFQFRFYRNMNEHGYPMGRANGTIFKIVFETTADQSFMSWAVATDMTKHVKIVISPIAATSKSRTIELYDVHCVYFSNNFNAQSGEPMTTLIHLTPAIMIDEGYKILDHYWKKTDLSTENVAPTIIQQDKELEIIDIYYEDKEGNKIERIYLGDILLVLKTKNGEGKKLDIDLQDQEHTYIYEGDKVEEGILKNIAIIGDTTKVELKVIPLLVSKD